MPKNSGLKLSQIPPINPTFRFDNIFCICLAWPVCSTFEKGTLSRFYNDIKYRSCYDLYAKYINNHYIESYYLLRVKKIMPTIL